MILKISPVLLWERLLPRLVTRVLSKIFHFDLLAHGAVFLHTLVGRHLHINIMLKSLTVNTISVAETVLQPL